MLKKDLRKKMKTLRDGMSKDENLRLSLKIAESLFMTPEYKKAENVLIFVSYGSEVDTIPIIKRAISEGKKVAVPRIDDGIMDFYEIKGLDELIPGFYGILEPDESHIVRIEPGSALVIVPGLVFDRKLYRIGYGGGFYDRFFSEPFAKNYQKVAIAFDFQVLKEDYIDADENDIPVDLIITESSKYFI